MSSPIASEHIGKRKHGTFAAGSGVLLVGWWVSTPIVTISTWLYCVTAMQPRLRTVLHYLGPMALYLDRVP